MRSADDLTRENQLLRERLSRLSEASVNINESLDFNAVLQEVIDNARYLTNARYGVIASMDKVGGLDLVLTSGTTEDEHLQLVELPGGTRIFNHFSKIPGAFRVDNYYEFAESVGLDGWLPMTVFAGLAAPIRHRGEPVGIIWLGHSREDVHFTREDEETLVLFASQAAMVIAISSRYRDEQHARKDLETLIDTSPVGVGVFDVKTGAPVSINREWMRIIGALLTPEEPPENLRETLTIWRADGRKLSLAEVSMDQLLKAGEKVRAEEMVLSVPDGRSVTVLMNGTPIFSEDGEVQSLVVTMQDMTPLQELERLRAEFLGMVSHELRAPLASIKGSASTLISSGTSLDPSETDLFFRIIEEQADHMSNLITDLLDVARIEAGALSVSPEAVDVAVLVDQARGAYLSGGGRANLRIDLPPELPMVKADRRRIVQVMVNLLSNAERYSPDRSTIRVTAEYRSLHVEFSVTDEGMGIPADHLPQLFRKFSRPSDNAGERRVADSGLGLAIAKGIVEAHGGRIWAESDGPGMGSRFTFSLPVFEDAGYSVQTGSPRPSSRSGESGNRRIRILAVDDDPQTLRYLRSALTEAGYAPFTTGDPAAVGWLIEERRPHLVLLDLMLPGIDGIDLMESVPGLSEVPVIFLSVYGRDQVVARALETGADDYIVKPFSPTELVARIQTVLRRRRTGDSAEPIGPYVAEDLTVNYAERRVYLSGHPIHLTDIEYRMLFELSVNAGRVMTHTELLQRVWGPAHSGRTGAVRSIIKSLRRKLGDDANNPTYIASEPRVGYRMERGEVAEREKTTWQ